MGERNGGWPSWSEPLRPDAGRRDRIREGIVAGARDELARRQRDAMLEVASGWTGRILPLAAAIALAFGWAAALGGGETGTPEGIRAERLVDPDSTALPGILVSGSEPSADRVLQTVVYER